MDITNHTSPLGHSTTLKQKQQLVRAVSDAARQQEERAALSRAGIAQVNHGRYLTRYAQQTALNNASPKKERKPHIAKRLSGAGRRTTLTAEEETELRVWVMQQRRSQARLAVSEVAVRMEATRRWGIPASSKWVNGWMNRQGLSMRLRTTHKEINTERMIEVKAQYQNRMAQQYSQVSSHLQHRRDHCLLRRSSIANNRRERRHQRRDWSHRALRRPNLCSAVRKLLWTAASTTSDPHVC